jgi:hypothetical protein
MPPTTETRWYHGAQSRLLTLQPLPTGLDPARTLRRALVAPALPPATPLGYLESSKSLANSKKFHGYLTLAHPSGACNLASDPRYDQKCCVRHTPTPTPFARDLHCSAAFDSQPKHPRGQPIRQVGRLLRLHRSTTRLLTTHLVTTCTHSKGTGFPV